MLDRRSALASVTPYKSAQLQLGEARGFSLLQVAGDAKSVAKVAGKLPARIGVALKSDNRTIMKTGPNQFWFVGADNDDLAGAMREAAVVTPLSHSRTRIFLEGTPARTVLAKSAPLDFHPNVFKPHMFAMTGIHHTPVLVHCVGANRFEIYALRTFALSVFEWLADAALEFTD